MATHLMDRGYDAGALHGDFSQAQREKTLGHFKKQRINVLIATDVAARGIDIDHLTHVINYSLPENPESYVHRIGRTGRAGREGTAITFITPSEYRRLMFIQKIAKTDIKKSTVPKIEDIISTKKRIISNDLAAILEGGIDRQYHTWAGEMLGGADPTELLAATLCYCFDEELNPNAYGEIKEITTQKKPIDKQGKARLFVALGKKDKMTPKKLVDLIMGKVSIKNRDINDIQIMPNFSFVTVPFAKAKKIVVRFRQKGGRSLITHAKK